MAAIVKKLFQFAVFLANIFSPVTFAGKISLEVSLRGFLCSSLIHCSLLVEFLYILKLS